MIMSNVDITKYGITDVKEIVYNPSYETLFKDETDPSLEGLIRDRLLSSAQLT